MLYLIKWSEATDGFSFPKVVKDYLVIHIFSMGLGRENVNSTEDKQGFLNGYS